MKAYNYKIQWLFPIRGAAIPNKQLRADLYAAIRALGAKSLTVINLLDENYKTIESYSNMVMFPYGAATRKTIRYISKQLQNNESITMVELIRK